MNLIYCIHFQSNEAAPITADNPATENSWLNQPTYTQSSPPVTNHQPLSTATGLHDAAADSYFDFDIPNSPAELDEYAHLPDSTATLAITPNAPESGYICASPISSLDNSIAVEHSDTSSTDEPFFDPECSDTEQRSLSLSVDYYDCDDMKKDVNTLDKLNQRQNHLNGFDSSSTESLPKSQSTTISTFTANTSESNNTLGNELDMPDFCDVTHISIESNNLSDECGLVCNKDEHYVSNHRPDHVDINLDSTNSISTEELIEDVKDVQEIPKYDPTVPKSTLTVENFVNGHTSDNDDEEPLPRPERFRRSSSLKTGKTPPGTPGRKKIVRFADVLGLDLADVRTFMDEIPKIPKSAYDELKTTHESEPLISLGQRLDKIIVPLFQQPGSLSNFLDSVQEQNVALENAAVTDPICLTITGVVRVRNLDFHKSVHIRYSLDAWQTYSDLQAEYVPNSCDGFSDKFSFTIFGNSMDIGQRIEIALRFSCKGEQFWDNNRGINYCFQCMPATTPQLQTLNSSTLNDTRHDIQLHESWCGSSFY